MLLMLTAVTQVRYFNTQLFRFISSHFSIENGDYAATTLLLRFNIYLNIILIIKCLCFPSAVMATLKCRFTFFYLLVYSTHGNKVSLFLCKRENTDFLCFIMFCPLLPLP